MGSAGHSRRPNWPRRGAAATGKADHLRTLQEGCNVRGSRVQCSCCHCRCSPSAASPACGVPRRRRKLHAHGLIPMRRFRRLPLLLLMKVLHRQGSQGNMEIGLTTWCLDKPALTLQNGQALHRGDSGHRDSSSNCCRAAVRVPIRAPTSAMQALGHARSRECVGSGSSGPRSAAAALARPVAGAARSAAPALPEPAPLAASPAAAGW